MISCPTSAKITLRLALCRAAKKQGGPPVRTNKKKKKKKVPAGGGSGGRQRGGSRGLGLDDVDDDERDSEWGSSSPRYKLPSPPAGFVLDDAGKVLMVSDKRIVTVVDSKNIPLECVIRRVFRSSRGDECMLLCPADMPVLIMKSKNIDGWSSVSDEEVDGLLPTVAYALAKVHMHLVHSGFFYTARGGFCFTEDDIFDYHADGEDPDGLPNEGIEITSFNVDGSHYIIYTPSDPILMVAVKDENGHLQIVDETLSEDDGITSAIDEETEFNTLVEEEAALLDELLGRR